MFGVFVVIYSWCFVAFASVYHLFAFGRLRGSLHTHFLLHSTLVSMDSFDPFDDVSGSFTIDNAHRRVGVSLPAFVFRWRTMHNPRCRSPALSLDVPSFRGASLRMLPTAAEDSNLATGAEEGGTGTSIAGARRRQLTTTASVVPLVVEIRVGHQAQQPRNSCDRTGTKVVAHADAQSGFRLPGGDPVAQPSMRRGLSLSSSDQQHARRGQHT